MKTFGKYQLLEEIGSGPAGTTYRARDNFRDSELALKVLRSTTAPTFKQQFCRELALSAELQHAHIETVLDLGEVDGAIYIAKELLAGTDLRRFLQEGAVWPLVQKLKFTAQICDGLAFAHRNKIVHGNINPSNIFLTANRGAKILDFGIASWPVSFATADAQPARLPNYLSPEQILEQPFDGRSDLFSVGILLYEFTMGLYPFQVPDGLIPREIVHSEPPRLRKLDPQIPEALERLLLQALDKDPQRRMQSADEFAVSLYAIARQLQAEQTIPSSGVSNSPAAAPAAAGNWVTQQSHLAGAVPARLAVSAGATGGTNPNLGVTTTPVQSANPDLSTERATLPAPAAQSTFVENAPSLSAAIAMPPAQVVPQEDLASLINGVESERQVATPAPSSKRLLVLLAGAAAGILILVVLLTHRSINASPSQDRGQATRSESILPSSKQIEPSPPAIEVPKPPETVETAEPRPQPKEILTGQVASLWEAGKYVQAMKLVDAILADDPSHTEARAWKARILAAQDAEASIK
jgi:serine/threonine-protein kinase